MTFDPYAELDVPKDADTATIKKAYRKRAKTAHPDAGGTAEEMNRAGRAVAILANPARRAKFDATGNADYDEVNNDRAMALQAIDAKIGALIGLYLRTFSPRDDPRNIDVIKHVKDLIGQEISKREAALPAACKYLSFLNDMKGRLSTTDKSTPIERSLDHRINQTQAELAEVRKSIEINLLAMKILETYTFRSDGPPVRAWSSFAGTTTATGGIR